MTNPHIKATWFEVEIDPDNKGAQWVFCVETDLPLDRDDDRFDPGNLSDLADDVFKVAPPGAKVRLVPKPRKSRPMPGIAGSESAHFEG